MTALRPTLFETHDLQFFQTLKAQEEELVGSIGLGSLNLNGLFADLQMDFST
jgi:hypothetical protein